MKDSAAKALRWGNKNKIFIEKVKSNKKILSESSISSKFFDKKDKDKNINSSTEIFDQNLAQNEKLINSKEGKIFKFTCRQIRW